MLRSKFELQSLNSKKFYFLILYSSFTDFYIETANFLCSRINNFENGQNNLKKSSNFSAEKLKIYLSVDYLIEQAHQR